MSTTHRDIEAAIMGRINSNWTVTNIHWPGTEFDPKKTEYIQPRVLWASNNEASHGFNRLNGVLHINVFVPIGTGSDQANQRVDSIRDLFPRGLKLGTGVNKIRFDVPMAVSPIEDEIWFQVPVECGFRYFEQV